MNWSDPAKRPTSSSRRTCGARGDAVIGAEAEVGILRGRVRSLEAELTRAIKEQQWFKAEIINRLRSWRVLHRRVIGKARRTLVK